METSATVIADSISEDGNRVTTMEIVFHRFCLAEFNTHCIFARNSASSRAIPVKKQLQRVREELAWPVSWPKEQKGMQGGEELTGADLTAARSEWQRASETAANSVELLQTIGLHKSVTNRLLEPFMWHTAIVTASSYENFFGLRVSPQAQPEIFVVASLMQEQYRKSVPKALKPGEWHLPYILDDEKSALSTIPDSLRQISAARCARVSYLTQAGVRDPSEDIKMFERLTSEDPPHASPLEHPCTPAPWNQHVVQVMDFRQSMDLGGREGNRWVALGHRELPKIGKFVGWVQLRHLVECERGVTSYR